MSPAEIARTTIVRCFLGFMLLGGGRDEYARADTVRLKNGLIYSGRVAVLNDVGVYSTIKSRPNFKIPASCPVVLIDDGPRRISIPGRQAAEVIDEELFQPEHFRFSQHKTSQLNFPDILGTFSRIEEFDEYGHGMIQLQTPQGPENVYLGIVDLRPDYVGIESLSHDWHFARTTLSLGADVIERILNKKIDRTNLIERKTLIGFYEQAEMYRLARQELDQLSKDFSSEQAWCQEMAIRMDELDAQRVLHELSRRRIAGQYRLVEGAAKTFPLENASGKIRRSVEEIITEYQTLRERQASVLLQLDMLQSTLAEEEAAKLRPLRSLLEQELYGIENLDRLSPFEQVVTEETIPASERLALAYSSWVVGPSDAVESLPAAIRLWDLRFLLQEYLNTHSDSLRREELLSQIEEMEGMSVGRLALMLPLLPMLEDMGPIAATVPTPVEFSAEGEDLTLGYTVVLPKEYNAAHSYPLLVVLHSSGGTPEAEARWWAGDTDREGQAQRRGFITIAPRYVKDKQTKYEYDLSSHRAVLASIRHAMRVFHVDADRIILAGHGMGGDACFDLGMSHPDLFAGVAPICGVSRNNCKFYWENALKLPWYVVAGQRDRTSVMENMRDLNRYFRKGTEIIYVEFKERGFESYPEELPRLMDWAETVRRKPLTEFLEFEASTVRSYDNRFYWIQAGSLPEELFQPVVWSEPKSAVKAKPINGKITVNGGVVYVTHPGKTAKLWFTPEMLSFDQRVHVHLNGKEKFAGVLKPTAEAILEDFRQRADRQRLFHVRLDVE